MAKIILNNSGNDSYNILSRDWTATPVLARFMKIILASTSQLSAILEVKNKAFTGGEMNRKIVLGEYVSALNKSSLILVIPFNPTLILDGNTYFAITIPANSTVTMAFYYEKRKHGFN